MLREIIGAERDHGIFGTVAENIYGTLWDSWGLHGLGGVSFHYGDHERLLSSVGEERVELTAQGQQCYRTFF